MHRIPESFVACSVNVERKFQKFIGAHSFDRTISKDNTRCRSVEENWFERNTIILYVYWNIIYQQIFHSYKKIIIIKQKGNNETFIFLKY